MKDIILDDIIEGKQVPIEILNNFNVDANNFTVSEIYMEFSRFIDTENVIYTDARHGDITKCQYGTIIDGIVMAIYFCPSFVKITLHENVLKQIWLDPIENQNKIQNAKQQFFKAEFINELAAKITSNPTKFFFLKKLDDRTISQMILNVLFKEVETIFIEKIKNIANITIPNYIEFINKVSLDYFKLNFFDLIVSTEKTQESLLDPLENTCVINTYDLFDITPFLSQEIESPIKNDETL